jgi:hypothetical protein
LAKNTQWHPLFGYLLRLLVEDYYSIDPEVSVSDLPRRGDFVLLRRSGSAEPPFRGLWNYLTPVNLLDFKGPTDAPEESDLELLMHVGCGITYRFNEERSQRKEAPLASRDVSFWYLANQLGDTFLAAARSRTTWTYEAGGLWQGRAWGHPVFLVSYRDVPVELDTVPLHLLTRQPDTAAGDLGKLMVQHWDLLKRYAGLLFALHPKLWEGVQHMIDRPTIPVEDWEIIGKYVNLMDVFNHLCKNPDFAEQVNKRALQVMGPRLVEQALKELGAKEVVKELGAREVVKELGAREVVKELGAREVVKELGAREVVKELGAREVVKELGAEEVVAELLKQMPTEQVEELLRRLKKE